MAVLGTHETYEQWCRHILALNADSRFNDSDLREPAREDLVKALGLDHRVHLAWADHFPDPTVSCVASTAVIPKQSIAVLGTQPSPLWGSGLGWCVSIVVGELAGKVSVSHHPTRAGAIEHFERLLGLYLPQ
jgi:hypothetical protein